MLLHIFTLFNIGLVVCSPTPTPEYHYIQGNDEVRRPTHSTPIRFNGVAIGTTPLGSVAPNGTVHSLADGHHFFQRGWCLTDTNGGSWEYLPDRRSAAQSKSKAKRQGINIPAELGWVVQLVGGGTWPQDGQEVLDSLETNFQLSLAELTDGVVDAATGISWSDAGLQLDLFDSGSFLTESTALVGDLTDIFFNALEIFFG